MTQEQQKLMHEAADECMSPDQRDLFDLIGEHDSDVFARLFRCVVKRASAALEQSENPLCYAVSIEVASALAKERTSLDTCTTRHGAYDTPLYVTPQSSRLTP